MDRALPGPLEMTGDQMVAAMDAVGVDGARLLISVFAMYRWDASCAIATRAAIERFALIQAGRPEPTRPWPNDRRRRPSAVAVGSCSARRVDRPGRSWAHRVLTAADPPFAAGHT